MTKLDFDIAIAGGGMVGASLALALRSSGHRIALIEPVAPGQPAQPSYDDRGIALSLASVRVLKHIGIWDQVRRSATPIRHVHVSEQGRFGCVRMDAARVGTEALGYVVVARELGRALWECICASSDITALCPESVTQIEQRAETMLAQCNVSGRLHCRLLVVADGVESSLRAQLGIEVARHDYQQTAIVANVTMGQPHIDTAYERFGGTGPLALLPLDQWRMVAVNCVASSAAPAWLALGDAEYCAQLEQRLGGRLGGIAQCGARRTYSLQRVLPERQVCGRAILLGSAAVNIHPNGAQGFNLALRDVAALAETLAAGAGTDPGAAALLMAFAEARREDRERVMGFSHGLARTFASNNPLLAGLRQMGMLLADLLPPVKRELMLFGAGLRGRQPACVRSSV
ncbi:MAG: hypothetical protein A3H91_03865 [Gammaproteobacteria bacterium RIFCSPLOWO2_02_FULL_61_13]|nr:MAG: hypothetical protein A3H91_03865 [Gammaproteobacteria bacterium RIFCSPLOWO2_02_FULL_61_13]